MNDFQILLLRSLFDLIRPSDQDMLLSSYFEHMRDNPDDYPPEVAGRPRAIELMIDNVADCAETGSDHLAFVIDRLASNRQKLFCERTK